MKSIYSLLLTTLILTSFMSCSDDDAAPDKGPLTLHFDNRVGTSALELNTAGTIYTNAKGEAYKITRLAYYISNIKLKKTDGTEYTDPMKSDGSAGYYLVDAADPESNEVVLEDIPSGDYTEVSFTIGVDASQVDHTSQVGPLAQGNGFFWNWNAGYIFLAFEGVSPASTESGNTFHYAVGGYKTNANDATQVNNIKTITLAFNGHTAPIRANHEPEVHLIVDINKFLNGPGGQVSFATNANRTSPQATADLATNIANAIVVDHVHDN
jgi:hypothetical protein